MSEKIPTSFLNHAAEILADTSHGLSGSKIVEYCNAWAVDSNVDTPHSSYPFDAPNKRTALQQNLAAFPPSVQYRILLDFCDRLGFPRRNEVETLHKKLIERFGPLFSDDEKVTMSATVASAPNPLPPIRAESQKNKAIQVFLCHASDDKAYVRKLYQRLKSDGFSPWLDEEDLIAGQDWQLEIQRAVRNTDVVLVCLSRRSTTKSGYVQKEIRIALDVADEQPEGTIYLIPAKLEECEIPDRLRRWQWVNLHDQDGYERLLISLKNRANNMTPATITSEQQMHRISSHPVILESLLLNKTEKRKENSEMARKAFYSFHYIPDNWRASQVRNIGVIEGNSPVSDNDWETVKKGGDTAIQNWIDSQLKGKSCMIVLIGANTAGRKWIKYEIEKAWNEGKGVLGIHIHNLKNKDGDQSTKGSNPFDDFTMKRDSKKLSSIVKVYDPPFSTSTNVYNHIKDNLEDWVEKAIYIRDNY